MAPLPLVAALAALTPIMSPPESSFVLSTFHGDSVQVVNLTCEPNGGLHPRADYACQALSRVDGDIAGMTVGEATCTLEYAPVRVRASGRWRGETRLFEAEYPNPCVLRAHTGPVFDF